MTAQDNSSGPTGPELGIAGLSGDFDLKYGLRLLWAGKAWILVIAILGLGLGFLATYLETPIYRAQALVQIEPPGQNLSALSNPYPANAFNYFDQRNGASQISSSARVRKSKSF